MASYPPPYPPPRYDPRAQRRFERDQQRARRDAERAQRDMLRYQRQSFYRSSILGPLLLIAVGIVVLLVQTGRIDRQRFWGWYGHNWPYLIVVAGVVLLGEWAFDQFFPGDPLQPRPRRSIGSGIGLLIFSIILIGLFAGHGMAFHPNGDGMIFNGLHMGPDSLDEFFGEKHESDQALDLDLPAGSSLSVVNPHGDVTIDGTSDDNRIHVKIHKQVYARTDSAAETTAQQLTPAVARSGTAVTLTMPSLDGARGDLVLTVPATASPIVTANHGDIHIASIKASVTATANHGDIELSAITGPATAHINSRGSSISAHSLGSGLAVAGHADDVTLSDITGPVSITGDFYGTTHLEHIAGTIHFHSSRTDFQLARLDGELEVSGSDLSASQVLGPVILTTSHENITLDRVAGDVAVTNRNGSIDLTAAPTLGNITLENRNGSIRTTLPDRSSFSVQADTTDGDIDTDLPLTAAAVPWDSHGDSHNSSRDGHKNMAGVIGTGGPAVHLATTNGDISIHKGSIAPLPLSPPAPPKLTLVPPAAPALPSAATAKDAKRKPKPADAAPAPPTT